MDQGRIAQRRLLGPRQTRCAQRGVLSYPELLFLGTAIVLLFCTDLNASPHGDAGFERFRTIAEKTSSRVRRLPAKKPRRLQSNLRP